jgi:DNA-binding LacI/PurR family transcriptional regulator
VQILQQYLKRRRPTAVILSSWTAMEALAALINTGEIKVPRDLSVISFDQHPSISTWLGNISPTTINMPLHEMGRRLAEMACQVVQGQELESIVSLPCSLQEGDSVAPPRNN